MLFKSIALAAAVGTAVAQRPTNTSICDYYTTALLKNNTAANQLTLLTLLVNTAVIGNYTQPNVGVKVAGILAPGEFNGTAVDLAPYFNGGFSSTNTGGTGGVSVNFLDGGGATPLIMDNKPADSTTSKQYGLLTHLYEYFGALAGCSMMGGNDFPAYGGRSSLYEVHKFMDIDEAEIGYFINQVAGSAASFGVAESDIAILGGALQGAFGFRCSPAAAVVTTDQQLQAICIADNCPISPNATCGAYAAAVEPSTAVSSLFPTSTAAVTGSATGTSAAASIASHAATSTSSKGTATGTATSTSVSQAAAATAGLSLAALAGGFAVLML